MLRRRRRFPCQMRQGRQIQSVLFFIGIDMSGVFDRDGGFAASWNRDSLLERSQCVVPDCYEVLPRGELGDLKRAGVVCDTKKWVGEGEHSGAHKFVCIALDHIDAGLLERFFDRSARGNHGDIHKGSRSHGNVGVVHDGVIIADLQLLADLARDNARGEGTMGIGEHKRAAWQIGRGDCVTVDADDCGLKASRLRIHRHGVDGGGGAAERRIACDRDHRP